jgi:NADPH:quinone reductase-like Zn-dependent oxidoreductase
MARRPVRHHRRIHPAGFSGPGARTQPVPAREQKAGVPLWRPDNTQDVAFLTRLLQAGSVAPVVDRVFPLSEVAAAFRRFGAQQHTGTIVITI